MASRNQMDKVISVFKNTARFSTPTAAKILSVVGSRVCVVSLWTQRVLERNQKLSYQLIQQIDMNTGAVEDIGSFESSAEFLISYSPSNSLKGLFRDVSIPNSTDSQKQTKKHLEIWKRNELFASFDVASYEVHGEVCTDSEFSALEWDPSETKLLYVAEKKRTKAEPFICHKTPSSKSEEVSKGGEYEFVEDWGESLVGKSSPTLIVCNLDSGEVKPLEGIPNGVSVGQAVWAPGGGVVGVAWSNEPRRLGLVYCSNRPSWIFHLTAQNEFIKLTKDGLAVCCPQFSPDGSKLVWIERTVGGPHSSCHRLMQSNWPSTKIFTIVDIIDESKSISTGDFWGLYDLSLKNCWFKDDKTVIVSTPQRASIKIFSIDTETSSIMEIGEGGKNESCSMSFLETREGYLIATKSSLTSTTGLYIAYFQVDGQPQWIPLVKETTVLPDCQVDVLHLKASTSESVVDFSAIYLGPKKGTDVPLVVWPHGGPHYSYTNSTSLLAFLFAKLGFAMVLVNYRGSIGAGENNIKYLLGKVGRADVDDVHQACKTVLEKYSNILNSEKVVLWGGSHGGFLVLHLAGQFPDTFQVCVALNPVADLTSFTSSDIPDWACVESGFDYSYTGLITPEMYAKMQESSPINYIGKVKIPILFLLGKKDLRVPLHNGMSYSHILKARNVPTKVLVYDDNHPLSQTPHEVDFSINMVLWFLEHLQHQVK